MQSDDFVAAGIPIDPSQPDVLLMAQAALEWLARNTRLPIDLDDPNCLPRLPHGAKLFLGKFVELMGLDVGVVSESIEGMSQTFDGLCQQERMRQLAVALLGEDQMRGNAHFVPAQGRWRR